VIADFGLRIDESLPHRPLTEAEGLMPIAGEFRNPQSAIRNRAMPVTCKKCRTAVPPEDVKADKHLAECKRCKEPFALDVPAVSARPPVPAGVQVTDDGGTRKLAFRWFRWWTPLMVLGCIAWDGFLILLFSKVFGGPRVDLLTTFFLSGQAACGVVMKYRTLCELVNRTAIEVGDVLRVQHGPIPWRGAEVPATDVTAVVTEPVLHRGKGMSARVTFAVRATTESGPAVTLLSGLDSLPRAQFYEWQIEEWLDLPPADGGEPPAPHEVP
jgi:hypothetical protein